MVPNPWYGGYDNAQSRVMVREYIAKYGGTPSGINSDVAEAYSVGQVAVQAVKATGGTDNSKIIRYLHSGVTLSSVEGPVKFDSLGENTKAVVFIFQWQNGKYVQVLPLGSTGSGKIEYPKPNWTR
jgi:ABC-type branched-subunit amino acid transport system substrate-binding protein